MVGSAHRLSAAPFCDISLLCETFGLRGTAEIHGPLTEHWPVRPMHARSLLGYGAHERCTGDYCGHAGLEHSPLASVLTCRWVAGHGECKQQYSSRATHRREQVTPLANAHARARITPHSCAMLGVRAHAPSRAHTHVLGRTPKPSLRLARGCVFDAAALTAKECNCRTELDQQARARSTQHAACNRCAAPGRATHPGSPDTDDTGADTDDDTDDDS